MNIVKMYGIVSRRTLTSHFSGFTDLTIQTTLFFYNYGDIASSSSSSSFIHFIFIKNTANANEYTLLKLKC